MTISDAVHKTILTAGCTLKPSAKATHGTHHRKHMAGPRQSKSRSGLQELDVSFTLGLGLTRRS